MRSFSKSLQRWSFSHAVAMIMAAIGALLVESVLPLAAGAAFMFLILAVTRGNRSQASVLSRPNLVTALRFICIVGVVWLSAADEFAEHWLALGATAVLISDALDGWIARKHDTATKLGALFDEEVDAFFLLALCVLSVITARTGWWIMIPGLMRYGFVLVRPLLARGKVETSLRSRRGRVVFVVMMVAMITTLVPVPALYQPTAALASLLLVISFLLDVRRLMRAPAATPAAKR